MIEGVKLGRPPKKNPIVLEKILSLRKSGKTHEEIAEIIGISSRTLTAWKAEDWEFSSSLKENEQLAKQLVEASLFKKATGFEHTVTTEIATKDGGIETIQQTQYYPPSDTSIIFYLKNRDSERWKDRREEEHKIMLVKQEAISVLSSEELLLETERLLKSIKGNDSEVIEHDSDPKIKD